MNKRAILILCFSVLICGLVSLSTVSAFGLKSMTSSGTNLQKIVLVTRNYGSVYIQYNYVTTSKVFYAYTNPGKNFDQYWGAVQGAKITANIFNSQGKIIQSFSGMTDSKGFYSAGFRIPDNFVVGKYSVVVTAQKGSFSDINHNILYVQAYRN